jgi:hypothetical protein
MGLTASLTWIFLDHSGGNSVACFPGWIPSVIVSALVYVPFLRHATPIIFHMDHLDGLIGKIIQEMAPPERTKRINTSSLYALEPTVRALRTLCSERNCAFRQFFSLK